MRFNHNLASALAFALPAFSLAPLLEDFGPGTMVIPNQFIVKLKNDTSTAAADEVWSLMSTVDYVYNATSFKGFSGTIDDTALAAILNHPALRVATRSLMGSWTNSFTDNTTYVYDDSAGEGVCVYVIDSGIRLDHEEFEGRAEFLINYSQGGEDEDTDGHGTHVAGTTILNMG
ncbi:hypothetical protein Daus18300_002556 [Diaporthe australafricana]|uniref:Peptidase S8/S53 domain-containing protein n=1 Tax=Diaporthe australafricana TaxID=127596 RepID=A0ABR3XMY0_9PEZI